MPERGYRVGDFTNQTPNPKRAACDDCKHHVAYVTWWCENKEAIAYRGSSFGGKQGVIECPFWAAYRDLTPEEAAAQTTEASA